MPRLHLLVLGLIMVLTAAFEFDPRNNKEATIRPTDNVEVPQVTASLSASSCVRNWPIGVLNTPTLCCLLQLIRELGNINVKKKEAPFCYPYSLKARVLVLAHLARMDVSEEIEEGSRAKIIHSSCAVAKKMTNRKKTLSCLCSPDQRFVVRKSPALLQEMINVGCQLTMMANSRGGETLQGDTPLGFLFCHTHLPSLVCHRFSRPASDHHRELHETDPDDRTGPAGVQVAAAAAATL